MLFLSVHRVLVLKEQLPVQWLAFLGISPGIWRQLYPLPPVEIKLDLAKSTLVTTVLEWLSGRGGSWQRQRC